MLNSPTNAARFHSLPGHLMHSPIAQPDSVGSVHSATSDSASSSISAGRGPKRGQEIYVSEDLKIAVDLALDRFKNASPDDFQELEFPSSLTSTERAYIHRLAAANNFKSKSKGKSSNRYITVIRQQASVSSEAAVLEVTLNTRQQMVNLIQRYPLTTKERHDLTPRTEKAQHSQELGELNKMTTGKLNNGLPQIPPTRAQSSVQLSALPIAAHQHEIVHTIAGNQVVLVSGETGCGKTTQVPQMILDWSSANGQPCRIICAQPRRIAALSVAERVANERGEKVGQIVGYQIRLESRVSPKTLLTYCTNGVLLRTLIAGENALATVTHIVVDEVHERDKLCDFLLIVLKQALYQYSNLRVVLMSATMNTELFLRYFEHCPIIRVPGSLYAVEEFYLEDVLKKTGYMTRKMLECKQKLERVAQNEGRLPLVLEADETEHGIMHRMDDENMASIEGQMSHVTLEAGENEEPVNAAVAKEMDKLLTDIWMNGDEDLFSQIYHYILTENVSADYQQSETGVTPLMAACCRNMVNPVEQLINLGANVHFKAIQAGCTALDIAIRFRHDDCVDLLQSYATGNDTEVSEEPPSQEISPHDAILLEAYHHSFDDERVDIELVMTLIKHVTLTTESTGAVLVFLPGYDDIVNLRDTILADSVNFCKTRAAVFTLHSNLQTADQKKVFQRPQRGVRKIILATNIAETSITIDDVVYVIDCGKVKEKSFDAFSNISMLKCNWISRASSAQRAGRAGRCRPGVAYHLFSSSRYKNMAPYQVAEMLRSPLQELCLQTKLLSPSDTSIADFLDQAPEPPSFLISRNAVQLLKQMDALDSFEDLTELGHHLVDIPIEPRLGKMIINAVILKCVDPILTITCTLAYKEPFMLPASPTLKRAAAKARQKFSADSMSDHMAYLRVFQAWQRARSEGYERSFCEKNFVSSATMEMIVGMRSQLLGQLRASGFVRARGGGDIRDLNTNSECWAVVKAALCAGTYPNLLRVDRSKSELKTQKESKVRFHQTSVLNQSLGKITANSSKESVDLLPSDWVIYEELCRSQYNSFAVRNFPTANARCATCVSAVTVALFAGPSRLPVDTGLENKLNQSAPGVDPSVFSSDSEDDFASSDNKVTISIDNWVKFKFEPQTAELVLHLRQKWHSLLLRRLVHPSKQLSQADEVVIRAIVSVLTSEEQAAGLRQPSGIGQRPRPMSTMEHEGFSDQHSEQHADDAAFGYESRLPKGHKISGQQGGGKRGGDNHSDNSSVKSSASSSRRSSTTNSPCNSPGLAAANPKLPPQKSTRPRYFVVKCRNTRMLDVSQAKNIWAVTQQTANRLNAAIQESQTVFLIFAVSDSGSFHGIASLTRQAPHDMVSEFGQTDLSAAYFVTWITRANVSFVHTQTLYNEWGEGQLVSTSQDGQELEPSVGKELVQLWSNLPTSPRDSNSHIQILQKMS